MAGEPCTAIRDIGEHVWGSFVIEPGTLRIVGRACLFCGEHKPNDLLTDLNLMDHEEPSDDVRLRACWRE